MTSHNSLRATALLFGAACDIIPGMWEYRGQKRPPFAATPAQGQESVWDYPRPPAVDPVEEHVVVEVAGRVVVDAATAIRVLETSHPPTYYLPRAAFADGVLRPVSGRRTVCEFKGVATYFDLVVGDVVHEAAAWTYEQPTAGYEALAGAVALYPQAADRITVDGEEVRAVQGDFYGGWVTSRVVGPFKGEVVGSEWW